ncbi:MAG TPA: restriction endonuclease subunit S [Streptomyces sp.]|uniref:restriction endonuclease subunit S n=1 Tax=Streptomyces sp. TaxID=1931 RepID=UPI002D0F7C10|nr:restriction endonuclease subunit S [Streptomyces sp.]HWU06397.1 restriction endonuclease subunit S [Streptomyces sp.]
MAKWEFVAYETLASEERSSFSMGPFGSKITKENYVAEGVPVVRGVNLARGIFVDDDFVFITEDKADEILPANVAPGDLIFTHRGTIGQVSMLPRNPRFDRYVIGSSQVKTRLCLKKAVPEFYFYWFQSEAGRRSILENASTVGVPGIATPLTSIRNLKVPLPALAEQEAVADVLGALDDKIAVNERIAATADALASALFEASEAKEHYRLSDVASIVMGQSPPGETYNETGDGIPFYQGVRDFGMRHPGHRVWCTEVSRHAGAGDVLVSVRAPVGTINVAEETCGIGRGVAAVRASQYPHVLLQALSSDGSVWRPYEAEGTVFGSINKKQLSLLEVSWPNESQIEAVEGQLSVLDRQVSQVLHESRSLSILRDTLLPQLMSGRLRVKDAEKIVEDHV